MVRPLRILVAQNAPHHRRGGMSRMLGAIHDRVERDGHAVEFFTTDSVPPRFNRRLGRFTFPWRLWRHAVAAATAGRPYDVINVHELREAPMALGRRAPG